MAGAKVMADRWRGRISLIILAVDKMCSSQSPSWPVRPMMMMAHRSKPAATNFCPASSICAAVTPLLMALSTASLPLSTPR
mgnify:CR=1 FL=1